ncbi:MAG: peroxide stress protein YaaA [Lachnospiraceae bacterium]|nr:peroxide stress protein YaaA [Lachnospiraceae bacterium]
MRIILSPAKKMRIDTDIILPATKPEFLKEASQVLVYLQSLDFDSAKKLWACSDKLARENYERLSCTYLSDIASLTPAVLAYDGIAFQYMAPEVFEENYYPYVQEHLRILSGMYGCLRALDGVVPYRLEMQAKAKIGGKKNLYDYWGRKLYDAVVDESHVILNLASKEYSKCIEKYLKTEDHYVTCIFGEYSDSENTKIVQKGVYAKMARGDMVRYMAENQIEELSEIKAYDRLGFRFSEEESDANNYVFLREGNAVKAKH